MSEFKRPTLSVPLYQSADLEKIEELRAALMSEASQTVAGPRLLSDTAPVGGEALKAAATAHDEFVNEAGERARKVHVEALPRKKWRELEDAHPARTVARVVKDEDGNESTVEDPHEKDDLGFNYRTMGDDLVPASVPLVGPDGVAQFASEDARDSFLDGLSDPHFNALYHAAIKLNTEGAQIPKAGASSLVERIIAGTSQSPEVSD